MAPWLDLQKLQTLIYQRIASRDKAVIPLIGQGGPVYALAAYERHARLEAASVPS